jgi:NADH-dependent peroxiredoxin subunit F
MLEPAIKTQLQAYFARITRPVQLAASLDSSAKSVELRALLVDLATLSPQITFVESSDPRTPSFAINPNGQDIGLRFAGIPMGHEFNSLVLALLQAGGYPPKEDPTLLDHVRALEGEYVFETYFSLSCQNCPDVVQALNLMTVLNPKIRHTAIDGALFQQEVTDREIMAVPSIFLNGQPFGQGRMTLEDIVARLDTGAETRQAAAITEKPPFDVLVVGGGPAGAAAAIYAARKGIRTGIATERFGGQVSDTMGIENYIGLSHTEGPKLVAQMEQHVRDYDVDMMTSQRAIALEQVNGVTTITLASGAELQAKTVILAPGASWRQMNVPGEAEYRNKGVAYCPHCDGPLFKGKRVAVIGGGNSGVEAAIDLAGITAHVTLVEFDSTLRADAVLQTKLRSLTNVTILTSAQTTEVNGDGHKVTGMIYKDRTTNQVHTLTLDGIFVQIGLLPNTSWLQGTLALSPRGEIEVDAKGQTSIPGIFAAGDATTVPYKQIVIAAGEGAKAALSAFDYLIREAAPVLAKAA